MTQLHTLSGSLQAQSPLWRPLRRSRKRLWTVANGCERLRTVANIDTTFREHSLTPKPPNETGTLATHSGKQNLFWRRFLNEHYTITTAAWQFSWNPWTVLSARRVVIAIVKQWFATGIVCLSDWNHPQLNFMEVAVKVPQAESAKTATHTVLENYPDWWVRPVMVMAHLPHWSIPTNWLCWIHLNTMLFYL